MRRIVSVKEVIEVLGGVSAVQAMTRVNIKAVYHWVQVETFPARLHHMMKMALKRRGYTAPARLWNQVSEKKAA